MLGKLFKHEFQATAKTFIWLYIAFVVIAAVNALLVPWAPTGNFAGYAGDSVSYAPASGILPGILVFLYVLAIAAMGIVTVVVIILRFYRNLLGDEGYLMMTLPVKRDELLLSKFLVSLIWAVCTYALIALSVLLLVASTGSMPDLVRELNNLAASGAPVGRWIMIFVFIMIISGASGILMLYASMAIGPNLLKNRLGGSILAFIIISVASQIITAVIFIIWTGSAAGLRFDNIVETSVAANGNEPVTGGTYTVVNNVFDTIMLGALISCAIIGVACWFLTQYMLKKKLNLA